MGKEIPLKYKMKIEIEIREFSCQIHSVDIATNEDQTKETIASLETCLSELTAEKESLEQRIVELSAVDDVEGAVDGDTSKDELIARLEAEHHNFQGVFNVEKGIFHSNTILVLFYILFCCYSTEETK